MKKLIKICLLAAVLAALALAACNTAAEGDEVNVDDLVVVTPSPTPTPVQTPSPTPTPSLAPTPAPRENIAAIGTTFAVTNGGRFAIQPDGSLWALGRDGTHVQILDNVVDIHICFLDRHFALTYYGVLWGWGENRIGRLGDGTMESRPSPVKIMDSVVTFSACQHVAMAVRADGSLWAWGSNSRGELSDGTTENRLSPVMIMTDVVDVLVNNSRTMVIRTDGSLWSLGPHNYPMRILDDVATVSVGIDHTAAITQDGGLWTWGDNWYGQLGHAGESRYPVRMMDDVVAVLAADTAGYRNYGYTLAIRTDGSLWGWGHGINAGPFCWYSYSPWSSWYNPVPGKLLDNVASIAGGLHNAFAITYDGNLWNLSDISGDIVWLMDEVTAISPGWSQALAARTDGSLWIWGEPFGHYWADPQSPKQIMDAVLLP